ncbi:HNH endonuclease [Aliivibrio fischeri]|uniref:HNH endonuclease n=1 Tax=Aliivibrio fischeri TaxID=668 RepID=UPI00166B4AF2|nr:HNH endonuclease [Aliivibrio fischeri]USR97047.1 HNH endonuclease [Aliivibrio fischeri ATCC 7744 = JCM 18803 = DSM 507]
MKTCIYCRQKKEIKKFSLEHVIPQFLGGSQAPDSLKTRDVCIDCNSNLGLFVDAAFEKDFMVFNQLSEVAYSLFDPKLTNGLPFRCMGICDLSPPDMKADEVCEYWLGPLGEQVFWVRPHDDQKYWYTGGNPRTVKKIRSKAYFMFSNRTLKAPEISWNAFKDVFIGKKVDKIMCTIVDGADPKTIEFSEPNELDLKRISYFQSNCSNGQERKNKVSMYIDFDIRFLAKLAIGLSYVYFGKDAIVGSAAEELYKALWFKPNDEKPKIKGAGAYNQNDTFLKQECGVDFGTTISLIPTNGHIALNLNINRKLNWLISCTESERVSPDLVDSLGFGKCFILVKPLNKVIELSLGELLAFNDGAVFNSELEEIKNKVNAHRGFFANL